MKTITPFLLILMLAGCSTVTVRSVETPKTDDTFSQTAVAFFWGLSDPVINAQCEGRGVEFVSAKTNLLYGICTVATLGIVVPMNVSYRCAGTPIVVGDSL